MAEMSSTFLLGTLFRAAIGRASGRVTAIRAWQAQHHLRTPNFLTVHSPQSTVHNFKDIFYEKSDLACCFGGVDEWRYYVRVGL
ncbi:MAG: hypothetical protein IKS20_09560 [Victivallales bacterium]|nr:hypothetical protein [Victivallales bacterium]